MTWFLGCVHEEALVYVCGVDMGRPTSTLSVMCEWEGT